MTDIVSFHKLPFYSIQFLEKLNFKCSHVITANSEKEITPLSDEDIKKIKYAENRNPNKQDNRNDLMLLAELVSSQPSGAKKKCFEFNKIIELLKVNTDTLQRSNLFYMALSRELKSVPTVEVAVSEYQRHGLHSGNTDEDRENRIQRFTGLRSYILKTFNITKFKKEPFNYKGFEQAHTDILDKIQKLITGKGGIEFSYPVSKKDKRKYTIWDLALAYWAISKSAQGTGKTTFSYNQLDTAFKENGKGCGAAKASALFKTLIALGLIEKVGGFCPGLSGIEYAVKDIC
jgi:hypothetical protein